MQKWAQAWLSLGVHAQCTLVGQLELKQLMVGGLEGFCIRTTLAEWLELK